MTKYKSSKKKKILIAILIFVVLLVAFRLYLPTLVLNFANKQLAKIEDYEGSIEDIDLAIIRGAYQIKGLELNKKEGKIPVPFFSAEVIDLSVEWSSLFKGEIVGEIIVDKPSLNFVSGPSDETSQTDIESDWTEVVDDLMPLQINRFEIIEGTIHYKDFHSTPKVDIAMENIFITAYNLTNATDNDDPMPASVQAHASVYGGNATLSMKIDPLNQAPTFDLNAEITNLDLASLNDFIKAYAKFDVENGSFSVFSEIAAKDNRVIGYARPIIKELKVSNWQDEEKNIFEKLWESVVEASGWVFKNQPEDQLATTIEFEGNINNPDIRIWNLIGQTLYNAFIQALFPGIENSINAAQLERTDENKEKEGFLKRIFKGKDDDKDKEKKG